MRICPNKRSKTWKDLVRRVGNESIAYNIFFLRDGDIEDITDEEIASYVNPQDVTPTISYKPIEKDLFEYNQDFEKISKVLSNLDVNKTLLNFITPSTIESTLQNAGFNDEMVTQLTDFYNSNRDLMYSAPNVYEVVNAYVSSKIPFGRTEIVKRADKELENKLLKWLEPLNISVKDLNDFKKNLNVNALGIADIINKTIYLAKERQIDTLPEEVAHFYVEFLEKRNKKGQSRNYLLYDDLINKIESWSEYQKYYDEYSKIYTKEGIVNIEKVKKEIIGKAIAEAVVRRFETKDLGLYSLIQEVIDYLRSIFKSRPLLNIQSLADDIAEKILSEDYSDIKKDLSEDVKLRDYKSVPKEVRDIIHNISSAGATMTGSVALRKAGTVYREDGEEFHDLDFKVSPTINRESFLNKIKKIYPSLTLKSEFQSGSSYTTLWNITVDGKIYDIDFFFETKPYNKLDNFVHWADTFAAKLDLGRAKDVTDFINYKPYKKFSLFPKKDVVIDDYLYYQTESLPKFKPIKPGVEELFESNPELANAVYEALGFNNLRKEYSNVIIDQVWKRLANKGITNADSLIGTRETINNKDFNKFWSAVKDVDIQNVIKFFESEKQKALDSYSKYKGEFDPTTGTFTSNDTSFFDNKIKDLNTLLQQKQQVQQLYSQYLDTIFPNSRVKNIVYHGGVKGIDKFDLSKTVRQAFGKGIYFSSNLATSLFDYASAPTDEVGYMSAADREKFEEENYQIYYNLINLENPRLIQDGEVIKSPENPDGTLVVREINDDGDLAEAWYVVPTSEQIHILGSQQDAEGFKQFVSSFQKTPTISYKPKPTNTISIVKQAQFRDSLKAGNKATFTYWSETTSKLVTEKDITITKVDYDRFEGVYEDGEERTFKYSNVIDDTISGNLNHKEQQIFKDNLKIGKVFENLKTDLGLINGEVTEIGTDSFKIGDIEIKYAEVYKEDSQIRLLDRIQTLKNSLSNQIVIFQSTMRTAAHKRRVDSLRKALEILENYDELVDLEEFFSEVSKNILTSKAYLISIAQKDLPTERKLALISYTKQFLDSFRYVEGLNNAIQNFEGCEKLKAVSKQLVADISDAKQEYFVVAQPAMAKILYEQFNPRTNEQLAELGMDPITEEDILKELNQPSKDLDLFNKFGVAPINSNDTLLGLFQKMIKNVKESARKMDEYFLRSLNPIVANLQKKYDIKKVMENFFTIEEVEVFKNGEPQIIKVRKFIKQYNVDEFNNDMRLFYQERDSAYMDLAAAEEAGDAVARDIARGKILKVNKQIDAYRQANGKIIDAKTSKYLTEKYIAKDPIEFNNLLDRYYTPVEFEQTNQDSITYTDEDTGITTYYNYRNNRWGANRDKYITTKYNELQKYLDSDPDIRAFYDIIIENYKRANRSIPTSYRLNGILPSIYEKNFIKDTKKYVTNFLEENIPQYMARIDGKAHKEIPIGFTKLIDVSESSDDTLKSLMMFFAEANNYSTMNNFLGATENMVELLSVTNPLDENQKQRVTSDVNNRLSAVIKSIDQSVYNKQRDSNGPLSKFIDLLNQFTSLTRMALKPLNWAVNILRGNMENLFEGIGGRHYTVRDLVWANKEFIKLQSTNPRKLANMIRTLDAIQGRFLKEYGDEFVSFKEKYLKTDILFLGQDLGEIQIQGTSMLAMLRAWGIEIPADGNFDLDALPTDFINTLHAVNKRNHGVYNNFDRLYAQDNALFRLFMQFRKYIAPTYRARFSGIFSGKYRIDQESGTPERGYYREFGEYVYKCMKNLNNLPAMLASFKSMPAVQKEGVRRTMAELIAFFTFYILVNLVKGGDDDEEDDEMSSVEWYTVYFAARLRGEIGAYLPVFGTKDQLRIINNPFAAAPVIRDMVDLFASVTDIDPDKDGNISIFKEYQRETGMYKKGELKILGKVSKLNPLDNVMETFYPEEMYDNFEAASKR